MGRLACVVIAVVLLAAACGDGRDPGDRRSGGPSATTTRAPTTETTEATTADLTLVGLNILHGVFCPEETDRCGAEDRVELFLRQLDRACPDLVALQEIDGRMFETLTARASTICDGSYEVVWHGVEGVDRELVLARVPVVDQALTRLAGGLRTAFWVRADTELGPVDLVVTHLASIDNVPCDESRCPPPCQASDETRVCQARQVLAFLEERRAADSLAVVTGDLNDVPGSPAVSVFTDAGFVDSHLAAGNAECGGSSPASCTAGREDEDLSDLADPEARQVQRIDYVLVTPPPGCTPDWDSGADDDGDGVPTGVFFPAPAEPTGASGVVFTSDHSAVALDLSCA